MKNNNVRTIVFNALICALYVAIAICLQPVSFTTKALFVEFRLSEALILLAFFNKKYGPGLILGCFLANLILSPIGLLDWTLGTFQTFLACLTYYFVKKLPLKSIYNSLIGSLINCLHCGLIIGLILTITYSEGASFLPFFMLQFLGVFVGEAIVLAIGTIIFEIAFKNKAFKKLMDVQD